MSHSIQVLFSHDVSVTSPTIHKNTLYTVSDKGDVFKYRGDPSTDSEFSVEQWGNVSGQPLGLLFDPKPDAHHVAFVCDAAHQAVLRVSRSEENGSQQIESHVDEYESCSLLGPNSIAVSNNGSGVLYFTDSGPLGETSLHNACGSVFSINTQTQLLIPLSWKRLAHPCGVALSPDESCVYVCETAHNRVLRFAQHPVGVYNCSVFHQFNGRYGPTAICVSKHGDIYVAHYEFENQSDAGRVCVLDSEGNLKTSMTVPGPEVNGLCLTPDESHLIITEKSTRNVYRHSLQS